MIAPLAAYWIAGLNVSPSADFYADPIADLNANSTASKAAGMQHNR